MFPGEMRDTGYVYPSAVVSVPSSTTSSVPASASQPSSVVISETRALVSREEVACERSWESFARRQGCEETWTFGGRGEGILIGCCFWVCERWLRLWIVEVRTKGRRRWWKWWK